jgi:hypothetical protein
MSRPGLSKSTPIAIVLIITWAIAFVAAMGWRGKLGSASPGGIYKLDVHPYPSLLANFDVILDLVVFGRISIFRVT